MKNLHTITDAESENQQYSSKIFIYKYHIFDTGIGSLQGAIHLISTFCAEDDGDPIRMMKWYSRDEYKRLVSDIVDLKIEICSSVIERVSCHKIDIGSSFGGEFGKTLHHLLESDQALWSIEVEEF